MNATEAFWTTVIGALCVGLGALLSKISDFYKARWEERRKVQEGEQAREDKGFERVIATLTAANDKLEKERKERIGKLEVDYADMARREGECRTAYEGLKYQHEAAQRDIATLTKRIDVLEKRT